MTDFVKNPSITKLLKKESVTSLCLAVVFLEDGNLVHCVRKIMSSLQALIHVYFLFYNNRHLFLIV